MADARGSLRSALRRARRGLARASALARPLRVRLRALSARPGSPSGIHLSWSEDPRSTLTVTWQTPTRHDPAEVEFRRADGGPTRSATGTSERLRGTPDWLHRAVLRELEPATSYLYRVSVGAHGAWSEARTAPRSRSEPYRAVFLCDVGLSGRQDGTTRSTERILREIAADPPLFYLGGGDYAYARRDRRFRDAGEAIDAWFEQMTPLFARAPFMGQYGNHEVDLGEDLDEWSARFTHPLGSRDGHSYSFDVGPAHFVALFAPGRAPDTTHLRWLEADLSSEAARAAAWRIVFQHAPVFASGSSHPARPEVRALMPLFERLGVDLHLSGHDQNYERTHPLRGARAEDPRAGAAECMRYAAGRGVMYAKVSPAGKLSERGLDFSRFASEAGTEIAARHDRAHHWARLDVTEEQLGVEVVGLADEGSPPHTVDRFALVHTH